MKLEISTYFYYTSGAITLGIFLHLPTLHQNAKKRIQDLHMPLRIPDLPKNFTIADYPDELDSESDEFKIMLESIKTMTKSIGIFVNSFDYIEGKALESLNKGLFGPNGTTPTIFSIGPRLHLLMVEM
ncbi:unnamed protein product [Vicia faba]|uniref:Uncharacterized protein n=1 Tax=Vicia faba TaxID=3906 RepID=A0AAV1AZV8_VICFA|nr:unnamed protein product [Vicia faba]